MDDLNNECVNVGCVVVDNGVVFDFYVFCLVGIVLVIMFVCFIIL